MHNIAYSIHEKHYELCIFPYIMVFFLQIDLEDCGTQIYLNVMNKLFECIDGFLSRFFI